jgi:hypothetical protein
MKTTNVALMLLLFLITAGCSFAQPTVFQTKPWNATLKIIGEDGQPISATDVSIAYIKPPYSFSDNPEYHGTISGVTDVNGTFSATHIDRSGSLGFSANKVGYYTTLSSRTLKFPEENANDRGISLTLVLKKISKPIAMYAKRINSLAVPEFNKAIGYDLMVGDWVGPYGKGVNADLFFTEKHIDPQSGYILSVSFPKPGDGIQEFTMPDAEKGSSLRSSHEAPVDNYQRELAQTETTNPNRNFYFRVRTKLDESGNVVSARYGKIYGDLAQFTYYLNSTPNDRNVEFDPKQNLLGGLESLEGVSAP